MDYDRDFAPHHRPAVTLLLKEEQVQAESHGSFFRIAMRLETLQAVQQESRRRLQFEPQTQEFILHSLKVPRGERGAEQLSLDKLQLLRREAGLNDTPKIVALLLVGGAFGVHFALIAVAVAMALGGSLNARQVAERMSHRLTDMNQGQGLAANCSTAVLVTTAGVHGPLVSTTHVSVGSLLGMGMVTGQTKWKPIIGVVASWVVTLPCAAVLAAADYEFVRLF